MKNKETLCSSCYLDAAYWLAFLIIHLTTRIEPIEYDTNMNKLFIPFMVIVCLLLTACDKDDALPGRPMMWSYEILTPDNVKFLDSSTEDPPKYSFKANSKEGNIIMTCENLITHLQVQLLLLSLHQLNNQEYERCNLFTCFYLRPRLQEADQRIKGICPIYGHRDNPCL